MVRSHLYLNVVRVQGYDLRGEARAAADAGLPLTTWLRTVGIRESRQLAKAERKRNPLENENPTGITDPALASLGVRTIQLSNRPYLQCVTCHRAWLPQPLGRQLLPGWWECPNGCNAPPAPRKLQGKPRSR